MSKFYKNIQLIGNNIFVRAVENGKEVKFKTQFQPTLFLKSNKKTKYKTLSGEFVEPIQPGTIKECKEFYSKYEDVDGFEIYGNERFLYQYISEEYSEDEIVYDSSLIHTISLDIETTSENGFPNVESCSEEILAITIQDLATRKITTWGIHSFKNSRKDVTYNQCNTEEYLLNSFLNYWIQNTPDIVTGWNCLPINSNIWKSDKISKLIDVNEGDKLYDSEIETIYPKSFKPGITQVLSNGAKIISSKEHVFPYVVCPGKNYTKLNDGPKSHSYAKDMSVGESMEIPEEKFLYVPLRKNTNSDNVNYTYEQCYLLGFIYTDGALEDSKNISYGFKVYQSDIEFITELKNDFSIQNKIVGPHKNCYSLSIGRDIIGDSSPIYDKGKKKLNIEILSTFSEKQFYMFLSGLLDGDGCVSKNSISFCNYNNDLQDLYELCLWNGIFSILSKSGTYMTFIDIDYDKLQLKKYKRWNRLTQKSPLKRNSSQKASQTRFKKINGGYLVKVCEYYESEKIEMLDIKTNTGYFISSGVKTHNCNFFDMPYLIRRISRVLGEKQAKQLSPWGYLTESELTLKGRKNIVYDIVGVSQLDYLDLYKKFTYKAQESYRLDYIAEVELGQKKLDHSEFDTFKDFYTKDWQKFIEYNILDTELVSRLGEKMKLIDLVLTMAYDAKVNYSDVFYQVRMWDAIIYNHLKKKNIVIPPKVKTEKSDKYAGAFVKEPIPGMYDWVVSLDLTSLYPSLMMEFNISPETLIEQRHPTITVDKVLSQSLNFDEYSEYSICPNGSMYRKDILGFLPELMEKMFQQRSLYKKKMLEAKKQYEITPTKELERKISSYSNAQLAKKVQLNSCYGSVGNPHFRFYKLENAEAITLSGQVVIRWIEKKLNEYLNKILKTENQDFVVAIDTDSVYLNLNEFVNKVFQNKTKDTIKIVNFLDKKIGRAHV